ncbi:MAG: class I SAM-dependent methyltransferase [Chloroflexi bacterium]|nr:class I SAM-dependent methyltransferase [Chloroflexota bacterium]
MRKLIISLASIYDPIMVPFDKFGLRRWREWAVSAAHGRVLELGVGTGLNLSHYRAVDSLAAIDPDIDSLQRALARRDGRTQIVLNQARAEELPFADESFDVVIGTLVFCSVGDPMHGLIEARRVLKSNGIFRLVEHVRVENRLIAGMQDAVTPLWKHVAGNCHLNRDTLAVVKQAGFQVHNVSRHIGGIFIGIDANK